MKSFLSCVAIVLLTGIMLVPSPADAQAPFTIEGPILIAAGNAINVMGVRVLVPPAAPISSPTNPNLTIAQIGGASPPLPGRTTPGFIGGTAIINGTIVGGVPRATDVFVEPAENVIVGTVTGPLICPNAQCTGLRIQGRLMTPLRDARIPAGPITNEFLFEVNLTGTRLVGRPAEAEGYFAARRIFYHTMAVTGGRLLRPTQPEVSILRSQCRDDPAGIQLSVDGFVHTPPIGSIEISSGATVFGSATSILAAPAFGVYRFRVQDNPAFATCPTSITATFATATATGDVDIIP